jgi:hypothetical protein
MSPYDKEEESRDEPIVLGTISSQTASSEWFGQKKSHNNIEISKHILVEETV